MLAGVGLALVMMLASPVGESYQSEREFPPVQISDLQRFPNRYVTTQAWAFNIDMERAVKGHIETNNGSSERLERICNGLKDRYHAWDALYDAWIARDNLEEWTPYATTRAWRYRLCMDRLRELRRLIGKQAYMAGKMPEPVPVELWEEVRP